MSGIDIVNAALTNDKESFMTAFNAAISSKVTDALEVKKVEIASGILDTTVEQQNEVETTDAEVSGTNAADNSVESAPETATV